MLKRIRLYVVLWTIAVIAVVFMMADGKYVSINEKNLFRNSGVESGVLSSETINELLLSANELSISEKKSFINLYLKSGSNPEGNDNENETREQIYQRIFQRKINKLQQKSRQEDFSIKPIPK
ncbi:MAG: hypothetical protein JNK27_17640 [Chitinophagaceae bacterium]|nr:hypothetical protein [Chitinophagaceae bacterium]